MPFRFSTSLHFNALSQLFYAWKIFWMPRVSLYDNSGSTMWLIGIILTMFQLCCYHIQSHYQHVQTLLEWLNVSWPPICNVSYLHLIMSGDWVYFLGVLHFCSWIIISLPSCSHFFVNIWFWLEKKWPLLIVLIKLVGWPGDLVPHSSMHCLSML
jgi:hypothetical protein